MTTPPDEQAIQVSADFKNGAVWLLSVLIRADREWADPVRREKFQARGLTTKYHFALAYVLTQIFRSDGVPAELAMDQALAVIKSIETVADDGAER